MQKDKIKIRHQLAFTLPEIMIALLLGTMIVGSLMSLWYFSLKSWGVERVRSHLRTDLESSMERIKYDLKLSSSNELYYYPEDATECVAISLPLAEIDTNGFLTVNSGAISWDKTAIYHVYDNPVSGKKELRRTIFWPRNNSWTATQLQNQIDSVVTTGDGEASKGSMSTSTEILFTNDIDFKIYPRAQQFDLYSPTTQRSNAISFGSILIASGTHTLRFEIVGKNPLATNYNIGIDCFSLTPSGGIRESDAYIPPTASSGKTVTIEDMSAYGNYSGNNQIRYNSTAIGDYITFLPYYDSWVESNFTDFILSNVARDSVNPTLRLISRDESGPDWTADFQTSASSEDCPTDLKDTTIRSIISNGSLLSNNVVMIRVKFTAHSSLPLKIEKAFISERVPGTHNAVAGTTTQLYFSDGPIQVGNLPTSPGTVGIGPAGTVIPGGNYVLSNWAYFTIDKDSSKDYLVTFYLPNESGNTNVTYWEHPGLNSYTQSGDYAGDDNWASSSSTGNIYALSEIQGWSNTGTATSTIYDTKLIAPNYGQLKWAQTNNSVSFKMRTSNNPLMTGATDWASIPTTYSANPSSLSGLANNRYVQYQASFSSSYPYNALPVIDNCIIEWPGAASLVEISGYFTKGPQYGIFKLLVDGNDLVKGIEINLSCSENYLGKTYTTSLRTEVSPRNTGK